PAEETEGAPPEETEAAPAEETEEPEAQQGQEAEPEGPTADELVAEGLAAKRAGRLDEAAERLRQALEIDAEHVQAHWVMAWVQVELDQKQEAIEHFRQVVELAEDEDLREQAEAAIERLQQ
ncbi:MAG: tetratricopeptide repeat protein, partial [Armatimonadota bacterium]|nr:tetratricopeptide repeat protein [Armatimonadota bacterium]